MISMDPFFFFFFIFFFFFFFLIYFMSLDIDNIRIIMFIYIKSYHLIILRKSF